MFVIGTSTSASHIARPPVASVKHKITSILNHKSLEMPRRYLRRLELPGPLLWRWTGKGNVFQCNDRIPDWTCSPTASRTPSLRAWLDQGPYADPFTDAYLLAQLDPPNGLTVDRLPIPGRPPLEIHFNPIPRILRKSHVVEAGVISGYSVHTKKA